MKIRLIIIHAFSYASVVLSGFANDRRPSVRIPQGEIMGIKAYAASGIATDAYLGLPYAVSPIGNLRFASPQRHLGWNGTYQATQYGPSCPQLPFKEGINEKEDCLYLNVWVPENSIGSLLPVVVLFVGEEFKTGGRPVITGVDLAVEGIIVIMVNYRLNVFGFLCFETEAIRGNMGILDQYFSILWVRENIKYFGGDTDKITLYGNSAGAASIVLHMISPRTTGYFQRAILASGSAISPWHITSDAKSASLEIVRILGCKSNYFPSTIQCIRQKTTQDILKAYEEHSESGNYTSQLLPVIDTFLSENNQYLPTTPEKAFKIGHYLQIPIMTGITRTVVYPQNDQWINLANQGYSHLLQYIELSKIPEILKRYSIIDENKKHIVDVIKWNYISSSSSNGELLLEELKYLEYDSKIEAPHYLQLHTLTSNNVQPIYVYNLDSPGLASNTSVQTDLLLMFGSVILNQINKRRYTAKELRFGQYVRHLWKNFIIFGNPTPNSNIKRWQKYDRVEKHIEYLDLDSKPFVEHSIQVLRNVNFWNYLLPKLNSSEEQPENISKELQNMFVPQNGYKHAIYTLSGLVLILLIILIICIALIKRRAKERERQFHMVY